MNEFVFESRDAIGRRKIAVGLELELAALRRLNGPRRLLDFVVFEGLWLIGAALALTGTQRTDLWGWLLCIMGIALSTIGLNANVLLLHEGMHSTLFGSRGLNRWVAALLGASVLVSFHGYRVMHTSHHTYLGDRRDPDDYRRLSKNPKVLFFLQYVRLTIGAWLYIVLIPISAWRRGNQQDRRGIAQDYGLLVALYLSAWWLLPGQVILYAWFLPIVLVAWLTSIRGLTQHGLTDSDDPFTASRTVLANPIVEFCLLSENFHLEHHLFPEIPSYHLGELHRLIWPHLPRATTGTSYLGFLGQFVQATATLDERPIGRVEAESSV